MIPTDYILREDTELEIPSGPKLNLASIANKLDFENLLECHRVPWPYEVSSIACITIGPVICQLGRYLDTVMSEAYRVLMPDGLFEINAPYYTHLSYSRNPKHNLPITEDTFGWYSVDWTNVNGYPLLANVNFKPALLRFTYEDEWLVKSEEAKQWARLHQWNVVKSVRIVLRVVK